MCWSENGSWDSDQHGVDSMQCCMHKDMACEPCHPAAGVLLLRCVQSPTKCPIRGKCAEHMLTLSTAAWVQHTALPPNCATGQTCNTTHPLVS